MLKNTMLAPPKGWTFYMQQFEKSKTGGWVSGMDLFSLVQNIIALRRRNPQHNWTAAQLDPDAVSVEAQNQICAYLKPESRNHYCRSCSSGPPPFQGPLPSRPPAGNVGAVVAGVKRVVTGIIAGVKQVVVGIDVLLDWLGEGGEPVASELAERRASVCADCPQNKGGPLEYFFQRTASELIRKQLELRSAMKLSTPSDEKLNVCVACGCPLKLKTWVLLEPILRRLTLEARGKLDERCWITAEQTALVRSSSAS